MTKDEGLDAGQRRFSVQRKIAVVARLLRGEPLELVARTGSPDCGAPNVVYRNPALPAYRRYCRHFGVCPARSRIVIWQPENC